MTGDRSMKQAVNVLLNEVLLISGKGITFIIVSNITVQKIEVSED
jgi:hypothetical protein